MQWELRERIQKFHAVEICQEIAGLHDLVILLSTLAINMSTSTPNSITSQQLLSQRLRELGRRIYGSLPWGFRAAALLEVLAADSLDAFGRVATAQMILAVVRGLPDVGGKPANDWIQDVHRRGPDALPPGTGRSFAGRVYRILLTKFGDPEVAEDAMAQVLLQAARGKIHIANGVSVHKAESLVITIALNAARDVLRGRGRRREDPLVRDDEQTIDVEDPEAFTTLDKLLPASELETVLRQLREVHPRAPEWLRARLDGDSGNEIATEWGVTPSYVSKWQRIHLPAIKKVVEHHLRQARQAYSYDRRAASY